jgi:hypothetical protein
MIFRSPKQRKSVPRRLASLCFPIVPQIVLVLEHELVLGIFRSPVPSLAPLLQIEAAPICQHPIRAEPRLGATPPGKTDKVG